MKATCHFIWILSPSQHLQGVTGGLKNCPLLHLSPLPFPPMMIFLSYVKMHFFVVTWKSLCHKLTHSDQIFNLVWRIFRISYVNTKLLCSLQNIPYFKDPSPSYNPARQCQPSHPASKIPPCQLPSPASHPSLLTTLSCLSPNPAHQPSQPANSSCQPAFPDSLAVFLSHDSVASIGTC